jgi:hypothetical protein
LVAVFGVRRRRLKRVQPVLRDIRARARARASGSTVTRQTIVDIIREDRDSH